MSLSQLGIDRDLITLVGQVLGDNAPFKSAPEHLASVAVEVGAPRFLKRLAAMAARMPSGPPLGITCHFAPRTKPRFASVS